MEHSETVKEYQRNIKTNSYYQQPGRKIGKIRLKVICEMELEDDAVTGCLDDDYHFPLGYLLTTAHSELISQIAKDTDRQKMELQSKLLEKND